MSVAGSDRPTQQKVVVAVLLAVVAVLLILFENWQSGNENGAQGSATNLSTEGISSIVDTLLSQHGIERKSIRTWQVRTPAGNPIRTERRVTVSPDFNSVKFNHELSLLLGGRGAKAVATERSGGQSVTVHIRLRGRVVYSMTFVVNQELRKTGSSHQPERSNPSARKR